MKATEFDVDTRGRLVTDITDLVQAFAEETNADGLLHVFLPHATAGVALMETGSGSEEDLAAAIEAILPRDDRYRHRHGSTGHGGDHLLPVFIPPSLTLAVQGGQEWEKWNRSIGENINRIQNQDGTWTGHHCITGRTFCTAAALMVLTIDRATVPLAAKFQRR